MQCSRCGRQFEHANFCPECGLPANRQQNQPSQNVRAESQDLFSKSGIPPVPSKESQPEADQTRVFSRDEINRQMNTRIPLQNGQVNTNDSPQNKQVGYGDNFDDAAGTEDTYHGGYAPPQGQYQPSEQQPNDYKEPNKKANTGLVVALVIVCIIAVTVCVFAFACNRGDGDTETTLPTQITQPTEKETQQQEEPTQVRVEVTAPPPTQPPIEPTRAPEPTNPPPTQPPEPEPTPTEPPPVTIPETQPIEEEIPQYQDDILD